MVTIVIISYYKLFSHEWKHMNNQLRLCLCPLSSANSYDEVYGEIANVGLARAA